MNWCSASIAEAVAQSKQKNAIFVVFIEGDDESSQRLANFINNERVRIKLESDDFVAIKIQSTSQAYIQFASIYQMVPVPSIFFIGKSGAPLEIGTSIIESVDELEQKINNVLLTSGKTTPSTTSEILIATEQSAHVPEKIKLDASQKSEDVAAPSTAPSATVADEIVCEGDVCYKLPKETKTAEVVEPSKPEENASEPVETQDNSAEIAEAMLEKKRKLLAEKRRERIELEQKMEKEREMRRREEGKNVQNVQHWQKEQELKELKDNIRRDRLEEQAARERIRAQIAADRAERAQQNRAELENSAANRMVPEATSTPQPSSNNDTARLQFRLSSGASKTQTFNCHDTLTVVRAYVKTELLPGTGIKDFILATTYPKREFDAEHDAKTLVELALFPSAVILVIAKQSTSSPAAIIARSGGFVNFMHTLFWTLLSPVFSIFGYLKNLATGGGPGPAAGAQKRAADNVPPVQQDAAKRRNLDRFMTGPSTSKEASEKGAASGENNEQSGAYRRYGSTNIHRLSDNRNDSDDENATWNGNSTQQQ